ncbi:MAG: hypothetical protein IPF98_01285 [Gemmatimonadetes bacterium]|nr:hypothetical protein [Gemmatimonadota bacterium]
MRAHVTPPHAVLLLSLAFAPGCTDSVVAPLHPALARAESAIACIGPVPDHEIPLPLVPPSQRVDLVTPVFSNPTAIDHALFPIAGVAQAVMHGLVDGEPLRIERTRLPDAERIVLPSGVVPALTEQFVAIIDRRIEETALDWYAQADDGAVWYLGEDVYNYDEGRLADREGTWRACREAPAAMIMPANPSLGNAYRPEDRYGVVFEEAVVTEVGITVDGPRGPVAGAIVIRELHMDGGTESKTFAPGYGEFFAGSGDNFEALSVAQPTDGRPGVIPASLAAILDGASTVFGQAGAGNWAGAASTTRAMHAEWQSLQSVGVPARLAPLMQDALDAIAEAVVDEDSGESRQYAVDALQLGQDIRMQYHPRESIDFARLGVWTRQVALDVTARNHAGIRSDVLIMQWILRRLDGAGSAADDVLVQRLQRELRALRAALDDGDHASMVQRARRIERLADDRGTHA